MFETVETAASTVTKTTRGRAERPYAPAHIKGTRDGSQNLTTTWIRRTRLGGEWLDGTGTVPLSESTEAYEVDILSGPATGLRVYSGSHSQTALLFDGSTTTYIAHSSGYPMTVQVDFETPQLVTTYRIHSGPSFVARQSATDWTFEGWNGLAWVVLDSRAGQPAWAIDEERSFTIAVPGDYAKYRLVITAVTAGTFLILAELSLFRRTTSGPNIAASAYAQGVVRTIATSAPSAAYSAANQANDFGAAQTEVFVRSTSSAAWSAAASRRRPSYERDRQPQDPLHPGSAEPEGGDRQRRH